MYKIFPWKGRENPCASQLRRCKPRDEPACSLNPEVIREVLDVIVQLAGERMTMPVVTHEMDFARQAAHQVMFMNEGKIVETGPRSLFLRF